MNTSKFKNKKTQIINKKYNMVEKDVTNFCNKLNLVEIELYFIK